MTQETTLAGIALMDERAIVLQGLSPSLTLDHDPESKLAFLWGLSVRDMYV